MSAEPLNLSIVREFVLNLHDTLKANGFHSSVTVLFDITPHVYAYASMGVVGFTGYEQGHPKAWMFICRSNENPKFRRPGEWQCDEAAIAIGDMDSMRTDLALLAVSECRFEVHDWWKPVDPSFESSLSVRATLATMRRTC